MKNRDFIYLDNNATTPIDPRVLDAMMPYLTDQFANAASTHRFGLNIKQAIEETRNQVAEAINADGKELIFTSGATEAINIALKGFINTSQKYHIITLTTEHKAVLDTCHYLEDIGYEIDYLNPEPDGLINLNLLKEKLRDDTLMVVVMFANNEIGTIQPISDIAHLAHARGALLMTDATQAFGKMAIDVNKMGIDILTLSAHKLYGPKGIGALYVKNGISLNAQQHGGGHENNIRSGTLNVPGIIGLGKATQTAQENLHSDQERIKQLRDYLEAEILKIEGTKVNGNIDKRLYNTTNICFQGVMGDVLIKALEGICVSTGSACTSAIPEPSYVLKALGLSEEEAFGSIRFSLGRFTTLDEVQFTINTINNIVPQIK